MDDNKETLFSGHSIAVAYVNSQKLKKYSQGLLNLKPDTISNMERGIRHKVSCLGMC